MAMAGQRILEAASSLCGGDNMENLNFAERLYSELIDEGLVIVGVSIGNESDTSTWTVQPQSKQSSAQPFIDAVNTSQWTIDANRLRLDASHRHATERGGSQCMAGLSPATS